MGRLLRWFFANVGVVRLCWRLMRDERVPALPKLLVAAALAYVVFPFDLIPEVVNPLLGGLDDLLFLALSLGLLLRLSPQWVVEEHREALAGRAGARAPRTRAGRAG